MVKRHEKKNVSALMKSGEGKRKKEGESSSARVTAPGACGPAKGA
jgi:hypothetical protein